MDFKELQVQSQPVCCLLPSWPLSIFYTSLMAFYIGHGLQYESESDVSSDFAEPDLDDDSEWEDPAGAFTRDTRVPIKVPEPTDQKAAPEQVPVLPKPASPPQPPTEPKKQRAVSTAPKPAHLKLMQVAPKSSPCSAQKDKTAMYLTKHC